MRQALSRLALAFGAVFSSLTKDCRENAYAMRRSVNQDACPIPRVRRLVNALDHKRGHFVLPTVMMVEVPCANTLLSG